ncbi:MAG: selenocysteine-specific translation elongation factor, partial [Desulfovibrio sp.]|nr:selenocysteine-specific translation elongation factor [Desulfovibrio sp.]
MPCIVGTAGHIDHGKTSLIEALTKINCDRLAEEKRRGITIDLGFAWLDLPNGERLGIIDVPGHERFVKTMVAGACGIDFVLLVVAADEGVMPQTKEHLEICSLLGVRQGLVVLTKIDCVDQEWQNLVMADLRHFLKGSFLEEAKIFPVSVVTGEGLTELSQELFRQAQKIVKTQKSDIFRLPIDRVFSLHGHGTVVTGTVLGGKIKVNDNILVYPSLLNSKVRSLERHGEATSEIQTGSRCAINLQGLEVSDLARGQILARPSELFPSSRWFVEIKVLPSAPFPLKQRGEVHFHFGTREELAKLIFRDHTTLKAGETAFGEVLLPCELPSIFG